MGVRWLGGRPDLWTPPEKFWSRSLWIDSGCRIWSGATTNRGYGKLKFRGKWRLAHQLAWELTYGPVPEGRFVLHACDVVACVNPDHLFLGDHALNMKDMAAKGRSRNQYTGGTL